MCEPRVKCCNSQQKIIIIHLEEKINMGGRKSQEKISEKPRMKQYKVMREKYQWLEIWHKQQMGRKISGIFANKKKNPLLSSIKVDDIKSQRNGEFLQKQNSLFFSPFQINWDDMVVLSCDFPYIKTTQAWNFKGGDWELGKWRDEVTNWNRWREFLEFL